MTTKRILVTGGAGFVGHHLIHHLLLLTDWEIISLDRLDGSGTLERLQEISAQDGRVTTVFHDLKARINSHVSNKIGKVDYIVHMAAASHVDRSIQYPEEFVLDNVLGTCHLLEWAKNSEGHPHFLYFSTDEVFGPAPVDVRWHEWARYNSSNPYAASKAGAEELCLAFRNTYNMNITITHTMNVLGTRQHPEKFVPSTIRKILNREPVIIHSSPKGKPGSRFYIDARDVASAVEFILRHPAPPSKINIVGLKEIDNLTLAKRIEKALPPYERHMVAKKLDFHSARPGHDLRYALAGGLLESMGFIHNYSITETINEVVSFSLENKRWLNL